MRSAAKHVMSCGKALPVNQTEEKFNKFKVHNKRESLTVYLFSMVTHQESPPVECSDEYLREMHSFQMNANANVTINNITRVTTI